MNIESCMDWHLILKWLDEHFYTYPHIGFHSLAPTGERYITLHGDGVKEEYDYAVSYGTPGEAIGTFCDALSGYAIECGLGGILYWRLKPELLERDDFDDPRPGLRYRAVSRLLISDRMPVGVAI